MTVEVSFHDGDLLPADRAVVTDGFARHSVQASAPQFHKTTMHWRAITGGTRLVGVLTAEWLWDWLYIDELWVSEVVRGTGLGTTLMRKAESYASTHGLSGLWLWTQSWQAADFYRHLGYDEFTRFPDFPKGYQRIGFRKTLNAER